MDHALDGRAEISGDEAHHLTRVLRVEVGQKFEVTDTKTVWLATVSAVRKSLVQFSLEEEIPLTGRRVVTFHASQKLKSLVEKSFNGHG